MHCWRDLPEAAPLLQGDFLPSLWQVEAIETVIRRNIADQTGRLCRNIGRDALHSRKRAIH